MKRIIATLALASLAAVGCNNNKGNGNGDGGGNPNGWKLQLTGLPASVATSTQQMLHATIVDKDGNTVTSYTGTVAFSSTDQVAYLPAQYTFTAMDAGAHDFTATLNTVGMQTVTAADTTGVTGSASTNVAGPAYYYVPAPGGKIALVVNADHSTPTTAVLDLVAMTDLTGYFVGFDVAVDATKLAPDANLMTAGTVLDPGNAPAAVAAAVPTSGPLANALVSGISQKASGTGAKPNDATIASGSVFYELSLPIKPGAAGGTIMDGTVAKNVIRAGLRNRVGTEVVGASDFAIAKLIYTP